MGTEATARARLLLLSVLSMAVLFLGFYQNQWRVAEQSWFDGFDFDSESLVLGRLVKSRQDGLFSSAGLTGNVVPGGVDPADYELFHPPIVAFQYEAYLHNLSFERYETYRSQIGFQAMLFGLLDRLSGLSPVQNLALFKALTSLFAAAALTAVIAWFYAQFGLGVALVVLFSAVLSQWLTVFGRNLWWNVWAFYLPLIAALYVLDHQQKTGSHSHRRLALYIFVAMFVKCLFTGCGYITTVLVAMLVPFVYYAIRDQWSLPQAVSRAVTALLSACAAILANLAILCLQVWAETGEPLAGIRHILTILVFRTYGTPGSRPPGYVEGTGGNVVPVMLTYLKGPAIDLTRWIRGGPWWWQAYVLRIPYLYIVLAALLATLWLLRRARTAAGGPAPARQGAALIGATWFAILGPLSWFVIFNEHACVHTFLDFITWHMPFTLFAFALCGVAAQRLGRLVRRSAAPGLSPGQ